MGDNPVVMLAVFGDLVFPLSVRLWLPKPHPQYRSNNALTGDFITHLKRESDRRGGARDQVAILCDRAYGVQKVVWKAQQSGVSVVSPASHHPKVAWAGAWFTPKELIEKVKERAWQFLGKDNDYQRVVATPPVYGSVVLLLRRRL